MIVRPYTFHDGSAYLLAFLANQPKQTPIIFTMDLLTEHERLQEQVGLIEAQDESRKNLIKLAVLRMLSLNDSPRPISTNEPPPTPPAPAVPEGLSQKLHDYELRISVLKLQLSTKEKVHDAQVDELKELVALLQKQLDEASHAQPKQRHVSNPVRAWSRSASILSPPSSSGRSISLSSKLLSPGQSMFSMASPVFARQKMAGGKGNSFSDLAFESIASKASLKLSQTDEKKKSNAYFTSPNSSAESTPVKRPGSATELIPDQSEDKTVSAPPEVVANLTNISVSDADETFQSANLTLSESSANETKKKKKIQLLSSHATKIMLELLQGKGLDVEDEDLNSLNYYHDDNFQDDHSSPVRATKRKLEDAEEPQRKRHVFKI